MVTILLVGLFIGLGIGAIALAWVAPPRRERPSPELPVDWWERFEAAFRAYAGRPGGESG